MNTTATRTILLIIAGVATSSCQTERKGPARPKVVRERPRVAPPDLPALERPAPLPAERVVELFYTSNVGGDAEPCG